MAQKLKTTQGAKPKRESVVGRAAKGAAAKVLQWVILAAVILFTLLLLYWFRGPIIGAVAQQFPDWTWPESLQQFLPDETMGFNSVEITNAVLGESRTKRSLVVLEQDVQVDSEVTSALANLDIFKKTKRLHSYGVGVFSVDLSSLTEQEIAVDFDTKTVAVTIPHPALDYVTVDAEKTTFEDTEHAILGFGEIKLTQEQQNELDRSVQNAMMQSLNTKEIQTKADRAAQKQLRELFYPLIAAVVTQEDFTVKIVFAL